MWGFVTSMNDILIPYMKEVFELTNYQAMLIQFAFFGAYFIGSLVYFILSARFGDPIARMGYQRGAVFGLVIAGAGALLFYPASVTLSYPFFLAALFTMGLGFTLLQISANPYVIAIGDESTGSSRLNLCQGVNSLGTTLGPLVGGGLILSVLESNQNSGAEAVQLPYLGFAGLMFALAIFIALAKLPRIVPEGTVQRGTEVLRKPYVLLGILTIFCYVGAEVSVGSIMIDFIDSEIDGYDKEGASSFVALYWGGLMIGRFLGAVLTGGVELRTKIIALTMIPTLGFFGLAFLVSNGSDLDYVTTLTNIRPLAVFLVLNVIAFVIGASKPGRTIGVFAICAAILLGVVMRSEGNLALWSLVAIGLFNSVMWSNVFALSLRGLGKLQSQASSLLVMAIVGGALLPLLQGWLADIRGFQFSFIVPLIAYLYIAFYGLWGHHVGRGNASTESLSANGESA
ncbi:MAG: FHS family L-fucose permease-like MFS transporter [Planctomycetota bacterium]|jgi:FHS family L-fucose permease-like MFS transporter